MKQEILEQAYSKYNLHKESGLDSLWITHTDILSKITDFEKKDPSSIEQIGASIEGRSIYKIKLGEGDTKVLLWSQMHGNESTATKAIFDLINYLTSKDEPADVRNTILEALEIHFIPMLNPDGAEKYIRENAISIDLNRDAQTLQSPEARLLQRIKDEINPEFCFNLHDQNRYYSVGKTDFSPALSFLAPPADYSSIVNGAREKAMQIIVHLNNVLSKYIPNQIAKYSDDHEPRSFGDNFNKQESSVILIESGYLKNDPVKEKVRELNFIALLSAFEAISTKSHINNNIEDYSKISENKENRFFDLLLKGAIIERGMNKYKVDIGINRYDLPTGTIKEFYTKGVIEAVGDLSTLTAYEIIDCTGLTAFEGKILNNSFSSGEISNLNPEQYFNEGYTTFKCDECIYPEEFCNVPFNLILRNNIISHEIKAGSPANFYLKDGKGVSYIIVNGFILFSPFKNNMIRNGLIFR